MADLLPSGTGSTSAHWPIPAVAVSDLGPHDLPGPPNRKALWAQTNPKGFNSPEKLEQDFSYRFPSSSLQKTAKKESFTTNQLPQEINTPREGSQGEFLTLSLIGRGQIRLPESHRLEGSARGARL
jgi:hypothetical protein